MRSTNKYFLWPILLLWPVISTAVLYIFTEIVTGYEPGTGPAYPDGFNIPELLIVLGSHIVAFILQISFAMWLSRRRLVTTLSIIATGFMGAVTIGVQMLWTIAAFNLTYLDGGDTPEIDLKYHILFQIVLITLSAILGLIVFSLVKKYRLQEALT